jgi:hypothetical protein
VCTCDLKRVQLHSMDMYLSPGLYHGYWLKNARS